MAELEIDNSDKIVEKVKKFKRETCGCALGLNGRPCSDQFTEETVLYNLNNCLELSSAELDLVILANIQVFTKSEKVGDKRSRSPRCNFIYQTNPICKEMFLHLYGIGYSRFRRLKEHYQEHGIFPRIHGNTKRVPGNATSEKSLEAIHAFIENYVEENAIVLPGRIPGFKNEEIRLLSSSETKMSVWREYEGTCKTSNEKAVSYRKFLQLWDEFYPDVVVAKPMTDLCLTCQQSTTKLQEAAHLSDEEKSECVRAHQEHLNTAQTERELYRNSCNDCEKILQTLDTETLLNCETRGPCSLNATIHYSFDFAQQVHVPSNPLQPGLIYFKTPRKCGIFGVMCEGIPRQVNFLIDEAVSAGKGANATISYVHYYLEHYGLGEQHAHLHADNCAGQNKNNFFLWYLAYRILLELHRSITYSFLIAGHTKFGPDRCFGLIKKVYKVTYISSLYEFARLVENSSNSGLNKAQLVGTHDGRIIVPVYDWASFLGQYFRKLPNIKSFHHFRFSDQNPGTVYYKEFANSPEHSFMLLKDRAVLPPSNTTPPVIKPNGLSEERKLYLYREIRQFCKPGTEDIVAPAP